MQPISIINDLFIHPGMKFPFNGKTALVEMDLGDGLWGISIEDVFQPPMREEAIVQLYNQKVVDTSKLLRVRQFDKREVEVVEVKNTKFAFKTFINSVLVILFGALFIFIAFKSNVTTTISIKENIFLESIEKSPHDQNVSMVFTTDEQLIIIKSSGDDMEAALYDIKGEEATHYFFDLYCFGAFPFGLRYYNHVEQVLDARIVLVNKDGYSFPSVGESFNVKMILYKDKALIAEEEYRRMPMDSYDSASYREVLNKLK